MAPSKPCPINGFKLAVLAMALLFSITSLSSSLPKSVHGVLLYSSHRGFLEERKLLILGSRPPGCVNKCSNCRPCIAALVVPSHQSEDPHTKKPSSSHGDEDDTYYLLSWKCRCGDKIFPP